ncbi:hypothetical protein QCA50_001653 [Cerrena zonata]|uniref:Uncharacterized protein n=1 Tax=Cerrena zonata TaxID=2478898 RepID=A0AAW0GWC3_9APHY
MQSEFFDSVHHIVQHNSSLKSCSRVCEGQGPTTIQESVRLRRRTQNDHAAEKTGITWGLMIVPAISTPSTAS